MSGAALINYRPPRIAQVLVAGAAGFHLLTPVGELRFFGNHLVGVVVGLVGLGVMMWGWATFRRLGAAVDPKAGAGVLVVSGPYRFSRNPMYLGMVGMLLGIAVYFGTLPFYVATVVLFLILNNAFCPNEEEKLDRALGHSFRQYRTRVRRWL